MSDPAPTPMPESSGAGSLSATNRCEQGTEAPWLARQLGHFAWGHKRYSPLRLGSAWRRRQALRRGAIAFKTVRPDGVALDGLYLRSEQTDPGKLPVLIVHGWVECKELYLPLARWFTARGHDVLLFDQRGHGRSRGDSISFSIHERHDVAAVIDGAQEQGWIGRRVIVFGHSMGAATVLHHAVFDERVAAVVASCPFTNIRAAITSWGRSHLPFVSVPWAMQGVDAVASELGLDPDHANPERAVQHVAAPVLLLLAGRDFLLPLHEHGHLVAAAIPAANRRVVEVPKANHFDICQRRWPEMDAALESFIAETAERHAEQPAV